MSMLDSNAIFVIFIENKYVVNVYNKLLVLII